MEVVKSVRIDSLGLSREGRRSAGWARRRSVGLELGRLGWWVLLLWRWGEGFGFTWFRGCFGG